MGGGGEGWVGRSDQEGREVAHLGVGEPRSLEVVAGCLGPLNLMAVGPDVKGMGPKVLEEGGVGY